MTLNRRSLLKAFGVGAAAGPVVVAAAPAANPKLNPAAVPQRQPDAWIVLLGRNMEVLDHFGRQPVFIENGMNTNQIDFPEAISPVSIEFAHVFNGGLYMHIRLAQTMYLGPGTSFRFQPGGLNFTVA